MKIRIRRVRTGIAGEGREKGRGGGKREIKRREVVNIDRRGVLREKGRGRGRGAK